MSQEQIQGGAFSSGLIGSDEHFQKIDRPKIENVFEEPPPEQSMVCCVHGAIVKNHPIAGKTVGWVRANLNGELNAPADADAYVEGVQVDDTYVLQGGQQAEFLKESGKKGKSLPHKDLRQI